MRTIERNYRKNPHTANFLMTFHAAAQSLPAELDENGPEYALAASDGADLLDTVNVDAPVDVRTPGQRKVMESLIEQIARLDTETGEKARTYTDGMTEHGKWTPGRNGNASDWIGRMIGKVDELKTRAPQAPAQVEDGIYELEGEIIKVVHAVHGSGRQYGKKLVAPAAPGENGSWERVPGIVARLRPEMKLDLSGAEKFGEIYGCCVRCARVLTKESSIARAMGDKCAGSF